MKNSKKTSKPASTSTLNRNKLLVSPAPFAKGFANVKTSPSSKAPSQEIPKAGVRIEYDENGCPTIHAHQTASIKTLEQLLVACDVDTDTYQVTRSEVNKWEVMSSDNGLVPLFQVKAKLERKPLSSAEVQETFRAAAQAFRKEAGFPAVPKVKASVQAASTMVEFALPDLHLGKLAWSEETGHGHWDVNRAEIAWTQAVDDLVARSPQAAECWFVLGNDFYNVDNQDETTTSGTPQDEDGRWAQTFTRGLLLLHATIKKLASKFPKIKIIVVPGNHDSQRAYYLGIALQEYYKGAKASHIQVDNQPNYRKYYQWGDTGIGFAHGDRIKTSDLSNLCQNEAREIWGKTKRFELHLGHLHQNMVRSIGGVTIRWLPALCPPDAWRAKSGYTMSEKAACLFEYDKKGLRNILMHYPAAALFA